MLKSLIKTAEAGEPVYINTVYDYLSSVPESEIKTLHCILTLLEADDQRYFPIKIPAVLKNEAESKFISEYVWAEIYNILSSLGGKRMDIYIKPEDTSLYELAENLNSVFGIGKSRSARTGYGRCINVIDRMLDTLSPESDRFSFVIHTAEKVPVPVPVTAAPSTGKNEMDIYRRVTSGMEGKLLCGIDVGGTDIKIVLVKDGSIICYKEYDWFPAKFTTSVQLVDPICLIVRLMRARATLDMYTGADTAAAEKRMNEALDISASEEQMLTACKTIENLPGIKAAEIDGVGMCFPDVVVSNKIVGGEVYKTRGIRNNPAIDYEQDFKQLTDLNDRIRELIKPGGNVLIINDGPMASFTAAVEIAASGSIENIKNGVFAHTLGTELGTGWVTEDGRIPDIPLEVYNFIIDLGSYGERRYEPDDLRSLNNFNTGLPGTLQKYTSQSGVFRLALKYFPNQRPDLFKELMELGFVAETANDGLKGYYVPTEPKDMRKPFLEHMMALPERENDEVNDRIWREIGEFLAVTWIETEKILKPLAEPRILFGRLVKRRRCFELMCEGAEKIKKDIQLKVADSGISNTPLMKQLEADPHFTVAQFAQAVGAVYFANR